MLNQIKQGNYIFFFGGEDEELEYKIKATTLAKHPGIQNAKNNIYRVPNERIKNQKTCFWVEFRSETLTSKQMKQEKDKLISCQDESAGWAVLCQGYRFKDCYKSEEL